MSEPTQPSEEDVAEQPAHGPSDTKSPGEILREARVAHNWSIDDLCAETKLSEKSVHALESNDFDALSQPVFAGGYYRQCAKALDIDTERLMAAYVAWGGRTTASHGASPQAVDAAPRAVTPSSRPVFAVLGVVVLLVIAGVVYALLANTNSGGAPGADGADNPAATRASESGGDAGNTRIGSGNSSATGGARPAPSDTQNADSVPRVSPPPGGADSTTGPRSGGRNVNDTLRIDRDAERRQREPQAAPAPQVAPNHLVVTFTDRSWVDIRDAGGARLLRGIFEAGDEREFDAEAPYRITLGYAPGVDMNIGGQPVDIAAQTGSDSTARLVVEAGDDRNP